MDRLTLADRLVSNDIEGFNVDLSATSPLGLIAPTSANLVDALGTLFLHGQMDSNMRTAIIEYVTSQTADPAERVRLATYLVITSSEYKVMN